MMRETTTLSNDEVIAADAEARRATAEAQFVIICNDKKRILVEIESLNKKIEESKIILQKALVDNENIARLLKEAQTSYIKEKESLQQMVRDHVLAEKDLENFRSSCESKKDQFSFDISSLEKSHEIKKTKNEAELKSYEDSKQLLLDEIKAKNNLLESLKRDEIIWLEKINALENSYKIVSGKNNSSESELVIIKNKITDTQKSLSDETDKLKKLNQEFLDKQNEIKILDSSIAKKNEEYNSLVSKIFLVAQRENLIGQKEAFIKNQYERAGIKWE